MKLAWWKDKKKKKECDSFRECSLAHNNGLCEATFSPFFFHKLRQVTYREG